MMALGLDCGDRLGLTDSQRRALWVLRVTLSAVGVLGTQRALTLAVGAGSRWRCGRSTSEGEHGAVRKHAGGKRGCRRPG